jgi:hypothetical protein
MKTQYHMYLLFLLFISSCKKERGEQLPEKTSRGANTFGCMIDNNVFAAKDRCDYSVGFNFQTNCVTGEIDYYDRHLLRIFSRNDYFINNQKVKINIQVQLDSSETKFVKLVNANFIIETSQVESHYSLDTLQNNEFAIHDALNRTVLYGSFTLFFKNNNGQLKILRDGRFDIEK